MQLNFHDPNLPLFIIIKFFFILFLRFYLFVHERHRETEAETQAEEEAGSIQGARCGT